MKHLKNEFKKWSLCACFVALTSAIVVLWSPVGDNLQDIWHSPERLTTIENDIAEINELLSTVKLDDNRMVTSVSP